MFQMPFIELHELPDVTVKSTGSDDFVPAYFSHYNS